MRHEESDDLAPPDKGGVGGFGDNAETLRRLRWRCRRGLLELDIWLVKFAGARLHQLTEPQCEQLEKLLKEADADLLAWLQGRQPVPEVYEQIVYSVRTAG